MGAKLSSAAGSRYTIAQNADINVTPFVDVMLVLLIIFMVSIPAATTSIKLDMPPAEGPAKPQKPVFISVMGPDDIYVADQKTTLGTLVVTVAAALRAADPATPLSEQRILVRGDKDVDYADFVVVLNELQQNGYTRIGLINEGVK